ncbi:hypothetical protein BDZ94DRAFT_622255 [Collybia nuda]|uniref:Uncharacterized protein n=1 Tax=Collybia nuda TaxID=64659 RepID=A0A9P6CK00_9AGAR|nr:hypothetical protein BDZ94DRAFT_622255 [Collybia nuda]
MPPRRASQLKKKILFDVEMESGDDELGFLASQGSTGSDDQALEQAIAQHYTALRDKKKKENERKFLAAAQKQLSQAVENPAEEVKSTVSAMESLFSEFLLQYAVCEDTIRNLWSQVQKEQEKLLTFAQARHAANIEAGKKVEDDHISGLSRTKNACYDFEKIIKQIRHQDS